MTLKETLFQDFKNAMKEKDILRKTTIQSIRAAVLQVEKDDQIELSDDDILKVISSQLKKRVSALPEFEKSGRQDLIDELKAEIEIVKSYLPEQLSDEELTEVVKASVEKLGATSMKDMRTVMSDVVEAVQGKADNKRISVLVKDLLS